MASMDDIYGGSALKAEELPQDFRAVVTVEHVSVQSVGKADEEKQKKLELRFVGKEKTLLLNITNANMMAEVTRTRDYEQWVGHRVLMYRTMTDFAGKRVAAIRLDHPPASKAPAPPPPPPPPFEATDDDVPFMALVPIVAPVLAALIGGLIA